MRRSRTIYYAVLAVVVLVVGAVAVVVLAGGEAAHTSLHTVSQGPPTLAPTTPSAVQSRAWSTGDHAAAGTPLDGGTVVTYSTHSVSGRNARTGATTWRYTRSDRTVCQALQDSGLTVAVYRRGNSCDEVTGLNSQTGQREWTRTLDENGQPFDGTPHFLALDDTFVAYTSSVIYAIGEVDSATRSAAVDVWTYSRYGCAIDDVVYSTAGTLVSQDCGSAVQCKGVSFCKTGRQVFLRSDQGRDDTSKPNFDHIIWNDYGSTGVPASADSLVCAVQPGSNVLDVLNTQNGKQLATLRLDPAPNDLDGIAATAVGSDELIWVDGRLLAVSLAPRTPAVRWNVAAASAPAVTQPDGGGATRLTITTSDGIASLDPDTGTITRTFPVPAPSGSTASPLGSGFLVASPAGTVAYR